jgi:hypothetical protein
MAIKQDKEKVVIYPVAHRLGGASNIGAFLLHLKQPFGAL